MSTPHVLADGIHFDPEKLIISREISEDAQLAYIEVSNEDYTTYLYVELDFSEYNENQLLWIVPFEDYPKTIDLSESTYSEFKGKFDAIDDRIAAAKALQDTYASFPKDYAWSLGIQYGGMVFMAPVGFLYLMGASASASARGGFQPVAQHIFPGIGSANVYKFSDGGTLQDFFASKGVSPPAEISQYLNKYIVAFTIDKRPGKLGLVGKFTFDNDGTVYYPSGTTQYFKDAPGTYEIRVITPIGYSAVSHIHPLLEEYDESNQYYVYSTLDAVNPHLIRECTYGSSCDTDDDCDIGSYCGWSDSACVGGRCKPIGECKAQLCTEDLEITLRPAAYRRPSLGLIVIKYLSPVPVILFALIAAWLLSATLTNKYFSKGWVLKDKLLLTSLGIPLTLLLSLFSLFLIRTVFNTETRAKSAPKSQLSKGESAFFVVFSFILSTFIYILIIGLFSLKI